MLGIKLKKFSHSFFVKIIVFLFMLASVAGSIYTAINILKITNGNIEMIFEKSYIESSSFKMDHYHTVDQLVDLIDNFVSEENILAGHTIDKDELQYRIETTYWDGENEAASKKSITEDIKQEMIAEDIEIFHSILNNLKRKDEPLYYVTDGEHTFTNTDQTKKEDFKKYPVYYMSEGYDWSVYPETLIEQNYFNEITYIVRGSDKENTKVFVGYSDDYIQTVSSEWAEKKKAVMTNLYYLLTFVTVFFLSLLYLIVTTGRDSFKDKIVHMNLIDKLFVDINIIFLLILTGSWFVAIYDYYIDLWQIYPFTIFCVAISVILLLSLVRHKKNQTFFKHTFIYVGFRWLYQLVKDIYDSGSVGMKIIVVVILYPIIVVASLVFFPITIGIAVWLALKKVKAFNKIQDGAQLIREGNLQHHIDVEGSGEFAILAANINGINEGFKQAVHNELKNERMKTELITNVSHDIRTPLTSLITYTDLLKTETDPEKIQEYIGILDQKSKRLKVLTDDLFAAAKASSGDIPVNLQNIDIVALINQGIGEVSERITAKNLMIKFNHPEEKIYVMADGKLLWRSIENILSNIFNYALDSSRVYIDITYEGNEILITFKNISKYELNITEEELMERFTRGDESRSSQGSGLGLSITKSLIENQNGKFAIKIDGDLFKSMIYLPKADKKDQPVK